LLGRTDAQRAQILDGARAVSEAGAYAIVIEAVPHVLAAEITRAVSVPTIGIGAGVHCDGQVMVMHDLLGLEPAWKPRFVRRYAEMGKAVGEAFAAYAADVRAGRFPAPEETYD
jgi:3-methyl-2-oxobutanoate hydroxymethyltransferase